MSHHLYLDFETLSECDIKLGSYTYARHPSTRPTCLAWAIDDKPVKLWLPDGSRDEFPPLYDGQWVVIQNAEFELNILHRCFGLDIDLSRVIDIPSIARAYAFPAGLGKLAKYLRLDEQKTRAPGVKKCFKPGVPPESPLWELLYDYCKQDVATTRAVHEFFLVRNYALKAGERNVWQDTIEMNQRGVPVDLKLLPLLAGHVATAVEGFKREYEELRQGGPPIGSTNPSAAKFFSLPNLKKPTVLNAISDQLLPSRQLRMLELRLLVNQAAVKKVPALLQQADPVTGRLHGALIYHGAHTGRWTSGGVQIHNMKRTTLDDERMQEVINLIESGAVLDVDDPLSTMASFVRPLIHHPTQPLLVGDFGQIEARVVAWLAGDSKLIDAFALGEDAYKLMASSIFKVPVEAITKEQRAVGKEVVLGAGFGMGVSRFWERLKLLGIDLPRKEARDIIHGYRLRERRLMPTFWSSLGRLIAGTADFGTQRLTALGVKYDRGETHIRLTLPSGRTIHYRGVAVVPRKQKAWKAEQVEDAVILAHKSGYLFNVEHTQEGVKETLIYREPTGKEVRFHKSVYTENLVQAIARDIMVAAMRSLKVAGYELLFTVHDEIVALAKPGQTVVDFERLMCQPLPWKGWETFPVAATAHERTRYTK